MKLPIEHLEIMVINACQLSCHGCATFSDLRHSGYVPWDQGKEEILPWLERLDPECIGVMGGEPLMNPDLENWIRGLRKILPNTQIRIPTNGFLLEKNWHLVDLLHDIGNTVLKISYHMESDQLKNISKKIINSYDLEPVTEYGINRWSTKDNFKFQINRPSTFLKSYVGDYGNMMPHDNDPREAFDICVAQRCPFIYKGLLYKCSTTGLTPELLSRYGRDGVPEWQPYINTGLSSDCGQSQLEKFVNNFGKPHKVCRQCPSSKDRSSLIDHQNLVEFK